MPFSALPGLGDNAAKNIIEAREDEPFFSVEDLQTRAKLTKSVIEILRTNGVIKNLEETDQITMQIGGDIIQAAPEKKEEEKKEKKAKAATPAPEDEAEQLSFF